MLADRSKVGIKGVAGKILVKDGKIQTNYTKKANFKEGTAGEWPHEEGRISFLTNNINMIVGNTQDSITVHINIILTEEIDYSDYDVMEIIGNNNKGEDFSVSIIGNKDTSEFNREIVVKKSSNFKVEINISEFKNKKGYLQFGISNSNYFPEYAVWSETSISSIILK